MIFIYLYLFIPYQGFPGGTSDEKPTCQDEPLEEGMATHSSVLAWRISWTEE